MIRVSEDELEIVGNVSSAAYKDGGYVAGLGISHNLHCLVKPSVSSIQMVKTNFLKNRNESNSTCIQITITPTRIKIGMNWRSTLVSQLPLGC